MERVVARYHDDSTQPSNPEMLRSRDRLALPAPYGDAMEAGVANHVWSVEEIVGLLG
jgi:hypothetical protein